MRSYLYNLATDKYRGLIPSLLKGFLYVLSLVYGLIIRTLMFIYHINPYRANCRVISVGNITLGGTGKTPLVEYIAGYLKHKGHKVAIVTRGYKRKITNYKTMGDEPYMLQENLKDVAVIVDADRMRGINRAVCDYGVDTVILDDGFQQWKIKKDLDIVTIDAGNPFGNRKMLPRGILRQPLSSLKQADVFVLTKTNINPDVGSVKDFLNQLNPSAVVVQSKHQPIGFYELGKSEKLLNIESLKGKTIVLVSAIARPDSFENLIKSLDINVDLCFRFPDHHNYTRKDLDSIIKSCKEKNIDTIIITEKDAVKLKALPVASCQLPVYVLRIELEVREEDEEKFLDRLSKLYSI